MSSDPVHDMTIQESLRKGGERVSKEEKKDTSPLVKARRIKRMVRIEEKNIPPSSLFDTAKAYPSDDLPEWFAPLQPIVEDETFTDLVINLGGRVFYHITLVGGGRQ